MPPQTRIPSADFTDLRDLCGAAGLNSPIGRQNFDSALQKFIDKLKENYNRWFSGARPYSDEHIGEQIFAYEITRQDKRAWSKYQLFASIKTVERLQSNIWSEWNTAWTYKVYDNIKLIEELIVDSITLIDEAEFSVTGIEYDSGGKRRVLTSAEVFDASQMLLRKRADENAIGGFVVIPSSIFLIRQTIELRLRRALGIGHVMDADGYSIKVPAEVFLRLYRENATSIRLPLPINIIEKIYDWTNAYVHGGIVFYIWQIEWAHHLLQRLYNPPRGLGGGYNRYGAIQIDRDFHQSASIHLMAILNERQHGSIRVIPVNPPECEIITIPQRHDAAEQDTVMSQQLEDLKKQYGDCVSKLFLSAYEKDALGFLYTILRVSGEHYGHWDPFEEFFRSMDDYDWILNETVKAGRDGAQTRIGLLMYCNLVEISSVQEIMANLLRCQTGQGFAISPFGHLYGRKKKSIFLSTPPSAKRRFEEVKRLAKDVGNTTLISIIDSIFEDQIRNAFVHADYCLTDEEFRWTHGCPGASVKLDSISELIERAFTFYRVFINYFRFTKVQMAKARKFHKLPNYEVLELLSNEHGLYGFKIHFSNGSSAYYERHPDKVSAVNLIFQSQGTINFMAGDLDEMQNVWKVDGKPVDDFDKLNAGHGS